MGNTAETWGAVGLYNCGDRFERCVFRENVTGDEGAVLHVEHGRGVELNHCTVVDNRDDSAAGCVFWVLASRPPVIANTIVAFNTADRVVFAAQPERRAPKLRYCDIFGNSGGDWEGAIAEQLPLSGNLWADPRFVDLPAGNVCLLADSPCIDAADPRSPPDPDPDRSRADMGACAYVPGRAAVGGAPAPAAAATLTALPRVTAGATRLCFAARSPAAWLTTGSVSVHDASGRVVRRLAVRSDAGGTGALSWDGRDAAGRKVPAGVYHCLLRLATSRAGTRVVMTP